MLFDPILPGQNKYFVIWKLSSTTGKKPICRGIAHTGVVAETGTVCEIQKQLCIRYITNDIFEESAYIWKILSQFAKSIYIIILYINLLRNHL